ncbi:MAG: zinc ABC transporter substrate-binding protein, partial [Roseibium sp.]
DPANAAVYDTNAAVMAADLQDLIDQTSALLEPVKGQRFLVFHDAYQYFETRFGLKLAGAIVQSDGVPPSAARLHALQEELEREQVNCIFSEPQFNPGVLNALTETKEISTAELDPIGVGLQLGPELYISVLSHMAQDFASCLATQS